MFKSWARRGPVQNRVVKAYTLVSQRLSALALIQQVLPECGPLHQPDVGDIMSVSPIEMGFIRGFPSQFDSSVTTHFQGNPKHLFRHLIERFAGLQQSGFDAIDHQLGFPLRKESNYIKARGVKVVIGDSRRDAVEVRMPGLAVDAFGF